MRGPSASPYTLHSRVRRWLREFLRQVIPAAAAARPEDRQAARPAAARPAAAAAPAAAARPLPRLRPAHVRRGRVVVRRGPRARPRTAQRSTARRVDRRQGQHRAALRRQGDASKPSIRPSTARRTSRSRLGAARSARRAEAVLGLNGRTTSAVTLGFRPATSGRGRRARHRLHEPRQRQRAR